MTDPSKGDARNSHPEGERGPAAGSEERSAMPGPQPGPAPLRLKIVALNIARCVRSSMRAVCEALARHRPDALLLSEVEPPQVEQIAGTLGLHWADTAGQGRPADLLDTAVLSRGPIIEARRLRSRYRAYGLMASVEAAGQGGAATGPIRIVSVHLRSTHPGPVRWMIATALQRVAEAALLLREVADLPGPMIVGGDFNAMVDSITMTSLARRFGNAFTRAGRGCGVTFPGFAGGIRIDHILHSRDLSAETCFVDPAAVSDHRALVATLRLFGEGRAAPTEGANPEGGDQTANSR